MGAVVAAAAAVAQAIRASGAIVRLDPAELARLVERAAASGAEPLVIVSYGGVFAKRYEYLMGYKGLVFYTKTADMLVLPRGCEVMQADKIWIPT